jgi:hypothetical protein
MPVDCAAEAGAEVREGFSIRSLVFDDEGRVCGIRGQSARGHILEERAQIVEIYPRAGQGIVAEETNDGRVYIAGGFSLSEFPRVRADIDGSMRRAIAECAPSLADRMQGARREEPYIATPSRVRASASHFGMPTCWRKPFTYELAPPTPEQQQLFGALRGNAVDTRRFLSLIAGTQSIPEFHSEANIGRIMAEASMPLAA